MLFQCKFSLFVKKTIPTIMDYYSISKYINFLLVISDKILSKHPKLIWNSILGSIETRAGH